MRDSSAVLQRLERNKIARRRECELSVLMSNSVIVCDCDEVGVLFVNFGDSTSSSRLEWEGKEGSKGKKLPQKQS
jgi:hypothetical protein